MSRLSGVSGDFPIQLATRLPGKSHNHITYFHSYWSAGGLLRCLAAVVFVRLSCRFLNSTSQTRTICSGQQVPANLSCHPSNCLAAMLFRLQQPKSGTVYKRRSSYHHHCRLSIIIGPILWGHSGPLCHALSLLSSSSLLLWTSMRRQRATVAACDSSDTW